MRQHCRGFVWIILCHDEQSDEKAKLCDTVDALLHPVVFRNGAVKLLCQNAHGHHARDKKQEENAGGEAHKGSAHCGKGNALDVNDDRQQHEEKARHHGVFHLFVEEGNVLFPRGEKHLPHDLQKTAEENQAGADDKQRAFENYAEKYAACAEKQHGQRIHKGEGEGKALIFVVLFHIFNLRRANIFHQHFITNCPKRQRLRNRWENAQNTVHPTVRD